MKIFIGHSSTTNYEQEIYSPLEKHFKSVPNVNFFFPERQKCNTKETIKSCDLFLAEVTNLRAGLAIEIGWADAFDKPICFLCKKGEQTSKSLNYLGHKIFYYSSNEEFLSNIEDAILSISNKV